MIYTKKRTSFKEVKCFTVTSYVNKTIIIVVNAV